ncbi:MAG TPA: 2-isopropylmalate synthase, partial [candidate division Zixibacteria bacterium]|nr:2-isopropylmalate synthase [candidate division Zixibacteria bacterium]
EMVHDHCNAPLPMNYPVMGKDAFRTPTGVHAAAVIKAEKKGDHWLADRVYSGVPAGDFGREQVIEIGFMSGLSNVRYWLQKRNVSGGEEELEKLAERILEVAKASQDTLTDEQIHKIIEEHRAGAVAK